MRIRAQRQSFGGCLTEISEPITTRMSKLEPYINVWGVDESSIYIDSKFGHECRKIILVCRAFM